MKEGEVIADLHIHSRYSRATSKNITLDNLVKYARIKGLHLLGTGDFTHPLWLKELKEQLTDNGTGILRTKDNFPFVLTTELSLMFSQEKPRKVHLLVLAPSLEIVEQINSWLLTKGRLDYDGRPIFGMSCVEFLENLYSIDKNIEIIPAHAWTPYFGIFGSMSGFNSLKEAFQEHVQKIHAIETGMSSDPEMNWKLSQLNEKTIVSFSDAHSFWPFRLGREATIFNLKADNLKYESIINQIRNDEILGTIETSPLYGKYHWDGHRLCNFSCSPEEALKLNNICPVCKRKLTIGVEHRVEELANQNIESRKNKKPFYILLPLQELIALAKASTLTSRKTWLVYNSLIEKFGNEFNVLLNVEKAELIKALSNDALLVQLIIDNRIGKIKVKPGFDGVYGEALLQERQAKLF